MGISVKENVSNIRFRETTSNNNPVKTTAFQNINLNSNSAVLAKKYDSNYRAKLLQLNLSLGNKIVNVKATITSNEAKTKAEEIIDRNGGKDDLNTDNAGRELAEIAKTNPADALLIAKEIYKNDVIKDEDRDEIAQSFTQALSDSDVQNLANSAEGQELLRNIETNLLDYPVHADEAADANRIRKELDKQGIFLASPKGMYPEGVEPLSISDDPNATPEEIAAYIKLHPSSSSQPTAQHYEYVEALSAHKDDAQWLAQFHSALGSELAGELISNVVDPSTHQLYGGNGTDPEFANRQAELVRHCLDTMQKGGVLTQEGMNQLINAMPKNEYVATEIFGKSNNSELRKMFINAAINNGDNLWDAGALHVLNTMSSYQQEQILNSLGDKLNSFIEGAMAGEKQIIPFSDAVKFGINAEMIYETNELSKSTFGGVEKLLKTANSSTVYYHARTVVSDFQPELQNKIFAAVTIGLKNTEVFDNFKENPGFKDELSKLFIRNGAEILKSQAPDGAFQNADFIEGMTKFFEITLFSPKGGELRDDLMANVVKLMGNVGDAAKIPQLSQSDYEASHNGWSQQDHVEVMGGLMGMIWQAADNQKSYIQNEILKDEAQKKELVGFFVGMAFSFVPGAGNVIGKIAEDGAGFLQKIPDKVIDFTWDKAKDQLNDGSQDFLLNLLKGSSNDDALANVGVLLDQFKDIIVATNAALPNGENGELNLRVAFQAAFSFYKNLVDLN